MQRRDRLLHRRGYSSSHATLIHRNFGFCRHYTLRDVTFGHGTVIRTFSTSSAPLYFCTYTLDLSLPLLLLDDSAEKPLPCNEPAEETIAISAHMLVRIRAFYKQIAAAYNGIEDPPASIGINLEIQPENFDPEKPECHHRRYHSRRLQLHEPETLPDLPFVSSLAIRSRVYGGGAENATDIRPLSPLVPLQCLVHLGR